LYQLQQPLLRRLVGLSQRHQPFLKPPVVPSRRPRPSFRPPVGPSRRQQLSLQRLGGRCQCSRQRLLPSRRLSAPATKKPTRRSLRPRATRSPPSSGCASASSTPYLSAFLGLCRPDH